MSTSLAIAEPAAATSLSILTISWQNSTHDPVPCYGVAGVYVIWRTARTGRECLAVGEARDIATDLACVFRQGNIAAYAASGAIEVSWAPAASMHRPGIARYLIALLNPALSAPRTQARPVPVNLPA